MRIHLVTDTHFNHTAIAKYCGRPHNFGYLIAMNWRRLVKPDDLVIHLGDVILGHDSQLKEILEGLPGTKVLVLGNHDRHPTSWYYRMGFSFVCDQYRSGNTIFSHKPLANLSDGEINICGHLHTFLPEVFEEGLATITPQHYVLAIEHMGYAPRPLDEILDGKWHRLDLHNQPATKPLSPAPEFSLTKEQYDAFVAGRQRCPACDSLHYLCTDTDVHATTYADYQCGACGFAWRALFAIQALEIINDPVR